MGINTSSSTFEPQANADIMELHQDVKAETWKNQNLEETVADADIPSRSWRKAEQNWQVSQGQNIIIRAETNDYHNDWSLKHQKKKCWKMSISVFESPKWSCVVHDPKIFSSLSRRRNRTRTCSASRGWNHRIMTIFLNNNSTWLINYQR